MTPAIALPLSFLEFLETMPEDGNRYELVNGERVQLIATRAHDDVADFSTTSSAIRSGAISLITKSHGLRPSKLDAMMA